MIYVAEVAYYDLALATATVAYYGSEGFTMRASDTPAAMEIKNRIEVPALVRRDVFDEGTTGGGSRVGYGTLTLKNHDGALDAYGKPAGSNWSVDGRTITVRVAASRSASYPAGYTTLFTGTMEQAEVSLAQVTIKLRDRQVFATAPFQPLKFGGTNVLPAGVDGIATDLKGKPIPVVLGACFNVDPPCVNTSKLIYQVHDAATWGALRDVTAVYDSGALLSWDAAGDYADQAAMEATAPAAGSYRVWKQGGMFRLGSSPAGQLTCDAVQGIAPANRTAAQLFALVATELGLSYSAADVLALDALNRATLGLFVKEEATNQQVLDDITRSVGAWWASDVSGVLRIKRLDAPSGSPVLALDGDSIVSLERIPLNDGGLPDYRVTVRGVPNYTVQNSGLVGVVGSARRQRLAVAYQDAIATDASVQVPYLLATERTVETKLSCRGACDTEATRLLTLYKVKRDRFEVEVKGTLTELAAIDLGAVVSVTYNRFGLDAGKLFRVLGYRLDPSNGTASLTVWG